jgi:hypothetical protein
MIKLQMASIPLFPRTSRNSWAMGKGRVVESKSETEKVAKDAAMNRSQPKEAVAACARVLLACALI